MLACDVAPASRAPRSSWRPPYRCRLLFRAPAGLIQPVAFLRRQLHCAEPAAHHASPPALSPLTPDPSRLASRLTDQVVALQLGLSGLCGASTHRQRPPPRCTARLPRLQQWILCDAHREKLVCTSHAAPIGPRRASASDTRPRAGCCLRVLCINLSVCSKNVEDGRGVEGDR